MTRPTEDIDKVMKIKKKKKRNTKSNKGGSMFKKIFSKACAFLFLFAVVAFAGEALRDSTISKLAPILGGDDAAAIWGIIVALVGIVGRVILKKIPTGMRGLAGVVFWNVMKGIFGDGVVLSNNTNPEYLKRELSKKYPLLQIEIKPESKA